jgi:sulfite exporter TauE/SafE
MFLFVFAAYLILDRLNLIPDGPGIGKNMSYGFIFMIGVAAAFSSCLAVAGGLLLAIAAKYNDANPGSTGFKKLKPTLYFNGGRVIGYTLFGGVIGEIGSVFTLSSWATGIVSIAASLVMIVLGFQLLNLFPWMKRFQPRMPKLLGHFVHDFSGGAGTRNGGPAVAGAATFFLPCGFTQALQLYVLSTGSPVAGALTMLAFSLGTLPGLLSLSMISSFARGSFQTYFVRFSAVVVVMLGFWNIQNGLALTGIDVSASAFLEGNEPVQDAAASKPVEIVDGKQIVDMRVTGLTYSPSKFTIQAGIPVEWRIDGREARGCAQVLVARKIGVTKFLPRDSITTINFTPKETGSIPFRCTMGMTTRGAEFTVIPAAPANVALQSGANENQVAPNGVASAAPFSQDPAIAAQKIAMEISNEKGFYPNSFVVKKGVPVDWTIDDKVELGGCLSVMVIPKYEVTVPFEIGINKVAFTPTETGTIFATCSMGSKMVQFSVID